MLLQKKEIGKGVRDEAYRHQTITKTDVVMVHAGYMPLFYMLFFNGLQG